VQPGFRGVIVAVRRPSGSTPGATDPEELELRLLEFGFVEGAQVEVLHEGPIGGDPIAVRVDDMRVALRRSEAMNVILAEVSA
jgi:ferrous iron transport protein A